MGSRGSTANVQRTRSTINSSRHSRIFRPESKMSGTEFHQLQSLAMTRPINPKTQEKQVLYEALRDDPQVQAARYKWIMALHRQMPWLRGPGKSEDK